MQHDQELSEQIERYLDGALSDDERRAFEQALGSDPALAKAVDLERDLRASLGDPQRRRLLDALAELPSDAPGTQTRLPLRLILGAALLLLLGILIWPYLRPEPPAPEAPQPPVREQMITDTLPAAAPPPEQPRKSAPQRPIASADPRAFAPNPALDPMVGTLVRGDQVELTIAVPEQDAVFPLRADAVAFRLSGRATGAESLTLRIYTNREADFVAGKTVYQSELPVENGAFAHEATLQVSAGRYYAVLSEAGEEEPLAVVRFLVR